jgi:DNA recombination protein RmuC
MLQKTRQAFDDLNTVTAPSGPSITTAARQLLKYGAQENKKKKSLASPSLLEEKGETGDTASQVDKLDVPS